MLPTPRAALFLALLLSAPLGLFAQTRLQSPQQIPNGEFIAPVDPLAPAAGQWKARAWNRPLEGADTALRHGKHFGLGHVEIDATAHGAWGWASPSVEIDATLRQGFRIAVSVSATSDYHGNYPWIFVAWNQDGTYLGKTDFPTPALPPRPESPDRGVWREVHLDIPAATIPAEATRFTLNLVTHVSPAPANPPTGTVRYASATVEPLGGSPLAAQTAAGGPPAAADPRVRSPFVTRVVDGPPGAHFAYPHSHAFWRSDSDWDPDTFVLGRDSDGANELSLLEFDPTTGLYRPLASSENTNVFYSITHDGLALASTKQSNNRLVLMDLTGHTPNRVIFDAPEGTQISHGADIREDGAKAIYALWNWAARDFRLQEIDVLTGEVETLMQKSWIINHAHYHPYDPNWISLCNEVGNEPVRPLDRIWAWHRTEAPDGRSMFHPYAPDGKPIHITHERAMFHKLGVIGDVVSPSPGEPRGLYEVNYDGTVRVVAEGKGYQHCNISRDGRWAVADVANQQDRVTMETILINFETGATEVLYAGRATRHPWHAHPHISPDGRWVILNDSSLLRAVALEIDQERLETFLGTPASR